MSELLEATPRMCAKRASAVPYEAKFCSSCGSKQLPVMSEDRNAVREFVKGTASEARVVTRDVLKNKDVQKIAAGAALGAVIAPIVPFLSIPVGATLGAGYVLMKRLTR